MTSENAPVLIQKSLFVNIVSWILVIFAAFLLITHFINLQSYNLHFSGIEMFSLKTLLGLPKWAMLLIRYFLVIFIFFVLKNITQIISGIGLLKRREWARILTIIIVSVNILITASTFWILLYLSKLFIVKAFVGASSGFSAQIMLIPATVFSLAFIVFYVWVIIRLNCKNIRQEFRPVNNM